MSAAGGASQGAKRKNFSSSERDALILYVLSGSKDGVLKRGAYTEAASRYEWHWETIKRIWIDYENQRTAEVENRKLVSGRKGNCGRKGVDITELRTRLRDVPLNQRTTIRRLAGALGVPKSTVFNNLKELGHRAHSNALKPYLTREGQKERLEWVLRWVRDPTAGGCRVLHDFEDFVHVDEKWFYLFVDGQRFLR